jgi:hypothetical protein
VLPRDFPWHQLQGRFDDNKAINECGKSDIWPVLAKALSWGYGASGTHGFKKVLVTDRIHLGGHGQYFHPDFVKDYWEPFIRRGEVKETNNESRVPRTKWWISALELMPLQWTIVCIFVFLMYRGFELVRIARNSERTLIHTGDNKARAERPQQVTRSESHDDENITEPDIPREEVPEGMKNIPVDANGEYKTGSLKIINKSGRLIRVWMWPYYPDKDNRLRKWKQTILFENEEIPVESRGGAHYIKIEDCRIRRPFDGGWLDLGVLPDEKHPKLMTIDETFFAENRNPDHFIGQVQGITLSR